MSRAVVWVLALGAASAAAAGWWWHLGQLTDGASPSVAVLLTGAAASLVVPALVGASRRPDDRAPVALALAGIVVATGAFRMLGPSWVATTGAAVWLASPLAVLWAWLEMELPDRRRIPAAVAWVVPVVLSAAMVVTSAPRTVAERPGAVRAATWVDMARLPGGRLPAPRQLNPLAWWPDATALRALWAVWALWVVVVAMWSALLRPRRGSGGIGRDARRVVSIAIVVGVLATVVAAWPEGRSGPGASSMLVDRWYQDLLLALPVLAAAAVGAVATWSEVVRPRLVHAASGALELDRDDSPASLQRRLERTLGDPTARVVFPGRLDRWIDAEGRPVQLAAGADRAATVIGTGDPPLAAIEYDAAVAVRPDLVDLAATGAALAIDRARSAARAEAAARAARSSATRLAVAEEASRDRLRRRLLDGPDQDLTRIEERLARVPIPLEAIHDSLRAALAGLRTVAHGNVPLSVYESGLADAVADLVAMTDCRIEIDGCVDGGADAVTMYLVIADAVDRSVGPVVGRVGPADGGVGLTLGGASCDPTAELVDRAEALGGRLGREGSTLRLWLPTPAGGDRP